MRTIESIIKETYTGDVGEMLREYHWGRMLTIQQMSKELGFSRNAIKGLMLKLGIAVRGQSEALEHWWANATEDQKHHQLGAAQQKSRELAAEGLNTLQVAWRNPTQEMKERAMRSALHMCRTRKRNGMTGRTGSKHHLWNPHKSKAERIALRKTEEHYAWLRAVYKRDGYVCQVCGYDKGGTLNAHHMDSYSTNAEGRFAVDNGVTLCEPCHIGFHKEYGYGDNVKEQFIAFRGEWRYHKMRPIVPKTGG